MKKNVKNIVIILMIILIIAIIGIIVIINSKDNKVEENNNTIIDEYTQMKEESIMYEEDANIEDLKEEYKMTGANDIYEITTESDGRKVLNVKVDKNYKVAFCGMIKSSKPSFSEIEETYSKNAPNKSGIWLNKENQKEILGILNNSKKFNGKYSVDEEGYLKIEKSDNLTELDKILAESIKSSKQYVLAISSICYMIDPVTGEIVDNPYNDLDSYQTYEYFIDNDRTIIFMSESKEIEKDEIFSDVLNLMELLNNQ